MANKAQIKKLVELGIVAQGAWPRGETVNGQPVDLVHKFNDVLIDELYMAIERQAYNGFHDPTDALPTGTVLWDSWIASETANGWTADRVYTWNGTEWLEETPSPGWLVWLNNEADFYKYTASGWETFAGSGGSIFSHGWGFYMTDSEFWLTKNGTQVVQIA